MMPVFADSFFYIALLNPNDAWHGRVEQCLQGFNRRLVSTAWVLTEVADAFAAPQHRPAVIALLQDLLSDANLEIVPPTQDLFEKGCTRFSARLDKHWSLTDCISFVVMEERGVEEALTGDRHFEQAGFRALFK